MMTHIVHVPWDDSMADSIKVYPGMKSLKADLPSRAALAIGVTMKGFGSDLWCELKRNPQCWFKDGIYIG